MTIHVRDEGEEDARCARSIYIYLSIYILLTIYLRRNMFELKEGRRMKPKTFASMVSNMLYESRNTPIYIIDLTIYL